MVMSLFIDGGRAAGLKIPRQGAGVKRRPSLINPLSLFVSLLLRSRRAWISFRRLKSEPTE